MLLAERVAKMRNLDEFSFWILSPSENTFLWKNHGEDIYCEFRKVLSDKGLQAFRKIGLREDFIEPLKSLAEDDWTRNWLKKFEERYLTGTY